MQPAQIMQNLQLLIKSAAGAPSPAVWHDNFAQFLGCPAGQKHINSSDPDCRDEKVVSDSLQFGGAGACLRCKSHAWLSLELTDEQILILLLGHSLEQIW